jgi:hypothetical protein
MTAECCSASPQHGLRSREYEQINGHIVRKNLRLWDFVNREQYLKNDKFSKYFFTKCDNI